MAYEPSEYIKQAISENNSHHLKHALVNLIAEDPCFTSNEFENSLDYIQAHHSTDMIEKYVRQDSEVETLTEDPSKWNKDYWGLLLAFLRSNFSPSYRVPHIKEVGKQVFSSAKRNCESDGSRQVTNNYSTEDKHTNPPRAPLKKTSKKFNWGILIATLVALIAIIVIIVTFVRKH